MNKSAMTHTKPNKYHFLIDYMIMDDSIELVETSPGIYTLKFDYISKGILTCSAFTFVEETFNVEFYTTERMTVSPKSGSEIHVSLPNSPNDQTKKGAIIQNLRVNPAEAYFFTKEQQNNFYPLALRLV